MPKFDFLAALVVEVVGVAVSLLHPNRLLRELFRGLQIVGIEFLGIDVVVRVGITDIFRPSLALEREAVLVTLVKDIARTNRHDYEQHEQRQLNSLSGLWT